jgi:hypothetical protein
MSDIPPPPPAALTSNSEVRNPSRIGKALWISFLGYSATCLYFTYQSLHRASIVQAFLDGEKTSSETLELVREADKGISDSGTLIQIMFLLTIGLFITWLFQLTRHSRSEGAIFSYGNGWAIGGFFIPFGVFFIPFKLIRENLNHLRINKGLQHKWFTSPAIYYVILFGAFFLVRFDPPVDFTDVKSIHDYDQAAAIVASAVAVFSLVGFKFVHTICAATSKNLTTHTHL